MSYLATTDLVQLGSYTALQATGPDAFAFLQAQVTCDLNGLTETHALLGTCCNLKGRVVASFWLMKQTETILIVLPKTMAPILLAHLKPYAVFSKVNFTVAENLNVFGTFEKINAHCFQIVENPVRYVLLMNNEDTPELTPNLELNDWYLKDIEQGFTHVFPETSHQFIPQMLNYEKFNGVSFNKGCYLGQEVIARSQFRGTLKRHCYRAFVKSNTAPTLGDEIKTENNTTAGTVVQCAKSEDGFELLAVMEDRFIEATVLHVRNQALLIVQT